MASVLELILRSRKEGDAAKKTEAELKKVQQSSDKTAKSFKKLNIALMALAGGAVAFIASATKLAARVEMLGVVTVQLGKTAGLTEEEVRNLEKAIQDQGITTQASRVALSRMIQANIDLAHSTDLARLSQDAAVIAGINSSEAFQHLINVIVTGNIRMGRTIGLQLQFGKALRSTAEQLGKNADELSEQEIIQARTNEVLRQGVTIARTYEAAMETAGKQMLSMDRQIEEIRVAIGEVFLPVLTVAVELLYETAKAINELVKVGKDLQKQEKDLAKDIIKVGGSYKDLREQLKPLVEDQDKFLYTQEELVDTLPNVVSAFEMMGEGYRGMSEAHFDNLVMLDKSKDAHEDWRLSILMGTEVIEEAIPPLKNLENATEDVEEETKAARDAVADFWGLLREGPGIVSALERNLEAIDYSQAGAGAVESAREGVEEALARGLITEAQADLYFGELYTAAQQIEVELGNITAYQASLNIRENIGGSLRDARTDVDDLKRDLVALVEEELLIRIRAIVSYGQEPEYQRGGSFIVRGPPGPDQVPVGFMATSGERVTITPASQTIDQSDNRAVHIDEVSIHSGMDELAFEDMLRGVLS